MSTKDSLIALSIFSGLYNERKNIYSIVEELILATLECSTIKSDITPEFLKEEIQKKFGFLIPLTVINRSCKRITKNNPEKLIKDVNKSSYLLGPNVKVSKEVEQLINDAANRYNQLFIHLKEYVEDKENTILSQSQHHDLFDDLYNYLTNSSYEGKYTLRIKAFIISHPNTSLIQELSQGAALYNGLLFTTDNDDFSKNWHQPFTVFLSTEIIFDFLGLNGSLQENYVIELLGLVSNANGKKKHIELKYTEKTHEELERFFYAAEMLIRNKNYQATSIAMQKVINTCDTAADIRKLFIEYQQKLDSSKIKKHSYQLLPNHNNFINFNLDSQCLREQLLLNNKDPELDIERKIDRFISDFTEIYFLRDKNKFENLEKSRATLLTRDSFAPKVYQAIENDVGLNGSVPFCTSYDILINRIWFKTAAFNRDKQLPITFDALARAKYSIENVLSGQVITVSSEISKILASNDYTDQDKIIAAKTLEDLKKNDLKSNDINEDNIESVMSTIQLTESTYEEISRNNRIYEQQTNNTIKELLEYKKNGLIEKHENNENELTRLQDTLKVFQDLEMPGESFQVSDNKIKIVKNILFFTSIAILLYMNPYIITGQVLNLPSGIIDWAYCGVAVILAKIPGNVFSYSVNFLHKLSVNRNQNIKNIVNANIKALNEDIQRNTLSVSKSQQEIQDITKQLSKLK